jgi:hypothetical protein
LRFILIDQRNSKEVKLEFSAQKKKNKKMKKPKTAERDKMSPNSAKSPSSCNIGIYVLDISIMIVYKDYTSPSSQLEA